MTATVALMGVLATASAQSSEAGTLDTATFAGGCFWCMQPPFANQNGVSKVVVGYTGGHVARPTYEQISGGGTGHYEAVQVSYDPGVVRYKELLDIFWRNIDPTDPEGQFADQGRQYLTAIFYHTPEQRRIAEESKAALGTSGQFKRPIATKILPAVTFYPAEDYHQDYYVKNPTRYQLYKKGSGREAYIHKTWGAAEKPVPTTYVKPPDAVLKKKLTPLQYNVTMCSATEPPFRNEYWDNHREGLYVDRVSGAPLFSSRDKFDSGTGWPSFTRPIDIGALVEKSDRSLGTVRTEVRSKQGDAHLGHLFDDGPAPTGQRYCMNSASLRFVPKDELEKEGYGRYLGLFGK